MADADNKIEIEITLDDGKVVKGLAMIKDEGTKTADALAFSFANVGTKLLGLAAAAASIGAIKVFLGDAVNQAVRAEAAVTKINNALKMAGTYTQEASRQFQEMADRIQRTTGIDAETVLSLEALARNLSTSNEQALKLTDAAIKLGAATGIGFEQALIKLNGTLSGTAGSLGKTVRDLEGFSQSSLRAGAAIDFVNAKFRDAALASSNSYDASLRQLGQGWNSLLKSVGEYITKSPSVIATFKTLAESIYGASDLLKQSRGNTDFFRNSIVVYAKSIQEIAQWLVPPIEVLLNIIKAISFAVLNGIKVFGLAVITGVETFQNLAKFASGMGQSIYALITGNKKLEESLRNRPDPLAMYKTPAAFDNLMNASIATKEAIKNIFDISGSDAISGLFGKISENAANAQASVENFGTGADKASTAIQKLNFEGISIFNNLESLSGSLDSISESFYLFAESFNTTALTIANDAKKLVAEAGANAFRSLANGVASGMGAIGKALVTGEDILQAFAGAMLSALGQAALQMGATYMLIGLAETLTGAPNGPALMGVGAALSVLGGALVALGQGSAGKSSPTVSSASDPGGYVGGLPGADNPTQNERDQKNSRVTVNIQGDVLDGRESGLRIVELINEAGFASGGRVLA